MIVPVTETLFSPPELQLSRQPNPFRESHLFPSFRPISDDCRVGRLWFLKIHTNSWIRSSQLFGYATSRCRSVVAMQTRSLAQSCRWGGLNVTKTLQFSGPAWRSAPLNYGDL